MKTCSKESCEGRVYARGVCKSHYGKAHREGTLDELPRVNFTNPEESFSARTEWQGECLIWTGSKDTHGYGQIYVGRGRRTSSHRYAWERKMGDVPEGFMIDHLCHNRACANHNHLRLASASQNGANRSGPNPGSTSKFRNVFWDSQKSKWAVVLFSSGKRYHLGFYEDEEEAGKVAKHGRDQVFGDYKGGGMSTVTQSTEKSLRSIAKSLEQVVHLLKGDRPGVLKEPATIELDAEALKALSDAVSEGIIQEEKEQE